MGYKNRQLAIHNIICIGSGVNSYLTMAYQLRQVHTLSYIIIDKHYIVIGDVMRLLC